MFSSYNNSLFQIFVASFKNLLLCLLNYQQNYTKLILCIHDLSKFHQFMNNKIHGIFVLFILSYIVQYFLYLFWMQLRVRNSKLLSIEEQYESFFRPLTGSSFIKLYNSITKLQVTE